MTAAANEVLRHAARLDGLAQFAVLSMRHELERLLRDLEKLLPSPGSDLTLIHRENQVGLLLSRLRDLQIRFSADVTDTLDAVSRTTLVSTLKAIKATGQEVRRPEVARDVAKGYFDPGGRGDVPVNGRTWSAWGAKAADDAVDRLASEVGASRGTTAGELREALRRAADRSVQAISSLSRTLVTDTSNRLRIELVRLMADPKTTRLLFASVLDGKTSPQCRGLDGTVWRVEDPDIARPPRHRNCRSHLIPVTSQEVESIQDLQSRKDLMDAFEGRAPRGDANASFNTTLLVRLGEKGNGKLVPQLVRKTPEVPVFERWLSGQSESFQRELLGPTRLSAWRRGLPLSRMATYDRPLTIRELRALYPEEVPVP